MDGLRQWDFFRACSLDSLCVFPVDSQSYSGRETVLVCRTILPREKSATCYAAYIGASVSCCVSGIKTYLDPLIPTLKVHRYRPTEISPLAKLGSWIHRVLISGCSPLAGPRGQSRPQGLGSTMNLAHAWYVELAHFSLAEGDCLTLLRTVPLPNSPCCRFLLHMLKVEKRARPVVLSVKKGLPSNACKTRPVDAVSLGVGKLHLTISLSVSVIVRTREGRVSCELGLGNREGLLWRKMIRWRRAWGLPSLDAGCL